MPLSGASASSAITIQCSFAATSFAAEDALRSPEHDANEEQEREHVAPLDVQEEAAHRDELREDERGDEAADYVAEATEHAHQEGNGAEGQADRRVYVVLQHEQAGGEPGESAAERRGDEEDAVRIDAHEGHDGAVLRDGADRGAEVAALEKQVHADHASERDQEGDEAREADVQLARLQLRQAHAEVAELDAEGE